MFSDRRYQLLAIAAFLSGANLRVFDSLLPNIASEFETSVAAAGSVVASFTLAYGLFQVIYGPLGDRIGRLKTIAIATSICVIGSVGSAMVGDLNHLTILRFLTGVGAAGIIPVSLAWIGDHSTYEQRQASLGSFISFILMGQIIGPSLGGALAQLWEWHVIFYCFSLAFFAVTIGLILIASKENNSPESRTNRQKINPLHNYRLIVSNSWCRTILLVVFIEGALFYGSFAFVGSWIEADMRLGYLVIGMLLSGFGLGGVIYTLNVRGLLRHLGERGLVIGGSIILTCFFGLLTTLDNTVLIALFCTVSGFGFYMLHNTLQTKASEMFPSARGTAISAFAMCLFSGQAVGTIVFGGMLSKLGYSASFYCVAIGLLVLGIVFQAELRKHR